MAVETRRQHQEREESGIDATDKETSESKETQEANGEGLTFLGRVGLFLLFPLVTGIVGMYFAFLQQKKDPSRELSFDQDFVMPFLLSLAMVIVIGFQTNGFRSRKVKPLVQWPKVKRVKKIVHRKNGQIISAEDVNKKDN